MRQTSVEGAAAGTTPESPEPAPGQAQVLDVVNALTTRLDSAGIRYCQFKSNWHLDQGLRGLTDLDVLIDPGAGPRLTTILGQSGYKRFNSPPGGDYPGVEDYLALDPATGRLVHLHLHHRLTTGEPHLKGYRFPWEELMLASRRKDPLSGFHVSDPAIELLFFLTRNTLKLGLVDWLRAMLGQDPVRRRLAPEFAWLTERAQPGRAEELGRTLFGEASVPAFRDILGAGPSLGRLLALRRVVMPVLRLYRTYGPLEARLLRSRRQLQSLHVKIGRRLPALAGTLSRTDPRGGVLIAFMGPDGAGKSRLTKEITAWLGWKLDVRVIYFGSGDGPSSLARLPLKFALRVAQALKLWEPGKRTRAMANGDGDGTRGTGAERDPGLARAVWALVLAREKGQNLRRALRARNQGLVVVCDRYPQQQIMGFNDGPLLQPWSRSLSRWKRALAEWESRPYRWAEEHAPSMVVKLHVTPAVAVSRKPEMRPEEIERRLVALRSLRYPPTTRVVDSDADRPWETVLLDCKSRVWEIL